MSVEYFRTACSMAVAAKDNETLRFVGRPRRRRGLPIKSAESGRVLVHCVQGLNRSGLVVAAALVRDGADVIDAVRTFESAAGQRRPLEHEFPAAARGARGAARPARARARREVSEARAAAPAPAKPDQTAGCCSVS